MEEQWKWILYNNHDFTGKYMVSDMGRIKSVARSTRYNHFPEDKILKQRNGSGRGNTTYKTVTLWDNGKQVDVEVHRLVATAFLPNPDGLKCVNHKDGNGTNNAVDNLEWCSYKQNARHSVDVLGNTPRKWKMKAVKQISENGELIRVWDCAWDVQRELGISQVGISRAARRAKKSGIFKGYRWDFVDREYDEH